MSVVRGAHESYINRSARQIFPRLYDQSILDVHAGEWISRRPGEHGSVDVESQRVW